MDSPALRFTAADAYIAADAWKFSCGPGALCAIANLTPPEVRPHLPGFRGWMNPSQMYTALGSLGFRWKGVTTDWPERLGILRIQWGGPWLDPGVPVAAAYRQTHWIASSGARVFDINALEVGGWLSRDEWIGRMVPFLTGHIKRATGKWSITHSLELTRRA